MLKLHEKMPNCRNFSFEQGKISKYLDVRVGPNSNRFLAVIPSSCSYICCDLDQAKHIVRGSYIAQTFWQQLHRGI